MTSSDFTATLPRKRTGAGVPLTDRRGRALLVEPTYKPGWEIPGRAGEADESPYAAAVREVHEQLGPTLQIGRPPAVDWVPPRPPRAA